MPAANIIQLRQLLTERFPGLRTRADELSPPERQCWPTGLAQIDGPLRGGLSRGALTEMVATHRGSGSALVLHSILRQALSENRFVAVVDGQDSLEVTQLGEDLSRLLWVRCRYADEALKAVDLLLRDGNLPLVLIDFALNPAGQLRKIPATTWYRFQRIVEQTSTVCLVVTPRAMVAPAQARLTLSSRFSLRALEGDRDKLLRELKLEVSETRRTSETREALPSSA